MNKWRRCTPPNPPPQNGQHSMWQRHWQRHWQRQRQLLRQHVHIIAAKQLSVVSVSTTLSVCLSVHLTVWLVFFLNVECSANTCFVACPSWQESTLYSVCLDLNDTEIDFISSANYNISIQQQTHTHTQTCGKCSSGIQQAQVSNWTQNGSSKRRGIKKKQNCAAEMANGHAPGKGPNAQSKCI